VRHVGCGGPILPVGKLVARVQVRDNRLTFRPGASGLEPVFGHGRVFARKSGATKTRTKKFLLFVRSAKLFTY
jgi:hypothetical protein